MRKVLVLVAVGALVSVAAAGDDAKKVMKKFEGTWEATAVTQGGKKIPDDEAGKFKLTFSGDSIEVMVGDKTHKGTYTLDPSKKPAQIDLTIDNKAHKGIYQIKGDKLKLCVGDENEDRPTEFASKDGTKTILAELKREKK